MEAELPPQSAVDGGAYPRPPPCSCTTTEVCAGLSSGSHQENSLSSELTSSTKTPQLSVDLQHLWMANRGMRWHR